MRLKKIFIIVGLLIALAGCTQQQVKRDLMSSEVRHYEVGMELMKQGDFTAAINAFKTQIKLYPDLPETEKATLQLVYAYYKQKQLNASISMADQFIDKYPLSSDLDYAYYSKGLALFDIGFEGKSGNSGGSNSDIRQAHQYFSELVNRFPESKYADDSIKRMQFLRDKLAESEVGQARTALNEGRYGSAVVHAKYVIENYKGTPFAIEALDILTQSYNLLSLNDEGDTFGGQNETVVAETLEAPAKVMPEIVIDSVGWRNAAWFHAQSATDYTIQLLMTRSEEGVVSLIDQYDLFLSSDYAYYPVKRDGEVWYGLVYGAFPTVDMAKAAIKSLPQSLVKSRPWIRKIGTLQEIAATGVY